MGKFECCRLMLVVGCSYAQQQNSYSILTHSEQRGYYIKRMKYICPGGREISSFGIMRDGRRAEREVLHPYTLRNIFSGMMEGNELPYVLDISPIDRKKICRRHHDS